MLKNKKDIMMQKYKILKMKNIKFRKYMTMTKGKKWK